MSLLREIQRRKVFQVAAVYAVVAWLVVQIVATVEAPLNLPEWFDTAVIVLLLVGFPITLIMSWAFNLTPEGLVPDAGGAAVVPSGGRRIEYVLIGLLIVAVGWIAYSEFGPSDQTAQRILPNSVAVLPFENLSLDPENAFFAAGIHEEILNQLAKLSALNVIARTSVMQYADGDKAIPEIAEELNVETIMQGSVRYADDRVLVTSQLIDAKTNSHLWSDSYNRDFSDIFFIQADIAMNVANALAVEFSLEEQRAIERPATDSAEAYALYLRALDYMSVDGAAALDVLDQVLKFDPEFARAHYLKAFLHSEYLVNTPSSNAVGADERQRHAQLASMHTARAAELDPAFEFSWIGTVPKMFSWHWSEVLAELEQAPDPMEQAGVWLYSYVDEHEKAMARGRRGVDLNPKQWSQIWTLAAALAYAGAHEEAARVQREAVAVAPANPVLHLWLAYIEIVLGNDGVAIDELHRAESLMGRNRQIVMLPELAYAYSRVGRDEDARRIFDELEQVSGDLDIGTGGWTMAYLAIDAGDRAVEQLERAAEKINDNETDQGFWSLMNVKMNTTADPLLEEPEFVALRNRLRGD
jgi:TolB-like protein/Flp pilus assembly protein TadD